MSLLETPVGDGDQANRRSPAASSDGAQFASSRVPAGRVVESRSAAPPTNLSWFTQPSILHEKPCIEAENQAAAIGRKFYMYQARRAGNASERIGVTKSRSKNWVQDSKHDDGAGDALQ